uniref:Uncharacterized protein n=1 Tax=Cacopsylla melanoneura TaxID=428564 RepID=A0A8D9E7Z2_9HEMI
MIYDFETNEHFFRLVPNVSINTKIPINTTLLNFETLTVINSNAFFTNSDASNILQVYTLDCDTFLACSSVVSGCPVAPDMCCVQEILCLVSQQCYVVFQLDHSSRCL